MSCPCCQLIGPKPYDFKVPPPSITENGLLPIDPRLLQLLSRLPHKVSGEDDRPDLVTGED